jgi:endonuclease-8
LEKLGPDAVVVHIHFGMAGTFHTFPYPGPEPRPTTRLQLENKEEGFVAHLSASLCVHCNLETYRISIAELGPDPLRQDADKEVVWSKNQAGYRSIFDGSVKDCRDWQHIQVRTPACCRHTSRPPCL